MGKHSRPEDQELVQQAAAKTSQQLGEEFNALLEQAIELRIQQRDVAAREAAAAAAEAKRKADLKSLQAMISPGTDKSVTKGLNIEFLIHSTVPKTGPGALLTASFDAAHRIHSLFQRTGVSAKVAGRFFGGTLTKDNLPVAPLGLADGYRGSISSGNSFDAAANHIMDDSRTAQQHGKTYIVITDGNLNGNRDQLAFSLEALKLNPKATVDFVVVTKEEKAAVEGLLEKLQGTPAEKQIKVTKVSKADEIAAAVRSVIRNRVSAQNNEIVRRQLAETAEKASRKNGPRVRPEGPSATRAMAQQFKKRTWVQRALFGQKEEVPTPKAPAAASPRPQ